MKTGSEEEAEIVLFSAEGIPTQLRTSRTRVTGRLSVRPGISIPLTWLRPGSQRGVRIWQNGIAHIDMKCMFVIDCSAYMNGIQLKGTHHDSWSFVCICNHYMIRLICSQRWQHSTVPSPRKAMHLHRPWWWWVVRLVLLLLVVINSHTTFSIASTTDEWEALPHIFNYVLYSAGDETTMAQTHSSQSLGLRRPVVWVSDDIILKLRCLALSALPLGSLPILADQFPASHGKTWPRPRPEHADLHWAAAHRGQPLSSAFPRAWGGAENSLPKDFQASGKVWRQDVM